MSSTIKNPNHSVLEPAQLLQLVLDTIPQKVFWKDTESVYLGCNQLFASAAGLSSPEEIIGLSDFDMPWTEEEAKFYRECDRRVIDSGQSEVAIVESQTTMDGKLIWLTTNKVPLVNGQGDVIGILGSYHDITAIKEAEQTLQRSNEQLEKRVRERTKRLRYMAQYDPLTGVANRRHFQEQLRHTVSLGSPFAMLFVDLDMFKPVNDTMGHDAGDQLLVQVGTILKASAPGADVGRFGGDEFTVLIRNVENRSDVMTICERIQSSLREDIVVDGQPIPVSASIGVVVDLEGKYKSPDEVLRDADFAMYEAKRAGKARYRICSSELLRQTRERIELEKQIREGIANDEFFVMYQPIFELETGAILAFESLVRWNNSSLGVLAPDKFLASAEETGLICDIGERVLREACCQLAAWRAEGIALGVQIHVNLSVVQLRCPDFSKLVEATLIATGLDAKDVGLEITESMLLDETTDAESTLRLLREKGHRLSLDDFGTGFSSLSYVHRFQLDSLKIDKSFIQTVDVDRSSHAIVRSIIGLAENLDLGVIAEGVETESQEDCLRELHCRQVQGYRFGYPMTAADATEFLASQTSFCNLKQDGS